MDKKEAINTLVALAVCSSTELFCDRDCPFFDGNKEESCTYIHKDFKLKEAIKVLKEEKDKEIEKLKKHNKELLRKLRNRVKEVKKLNKYSLYKKEFKRLNEQLKNKDKIIDLMAEKMAFDRDMNSEVDVYTYKRQIKQYFKSKAEKE